MKWELIGGWDGGHVHISALAQSSRCCWWSTKRPIRTWGRLRMKKGARIPKELIRWRRCLPYIQTFLVLIFLTNPPPCSSFLGWWRRFISREFPGGLWNKWITAWPLQPWSHFCSRSSSVAALRQMKQKWWGCFHASPVVSRPHQEHQKYKIRLSVHHSSEGHQQYDNYCKMMELMEQLRTFWAHVAKKNIENEIRGI